MNCFILIYPPEALHNIWWAHSAPFHKTLLYLIFPEHCNQLALCSSRYICLVFHSNSSNTDNIPCTPNNTLKSYSFNYYFFSLASINAAAAIMPRALLRDCSWMLPHIQPDKTHCLWCFTSFYVFFGLKWRRVSLQGEKMLDDFQVSHVHSDHQTGWETFDVNKWWISATRRHITRVTKRRLYKFCSKSNSICLSVCLKNVFVGILLALLKSLRSAFVSTDATCNLFVIAKAMHILITHKQILLSEYANSQEKTHPAK